MGHGLPVQPAKAPDWSCCFSAQASTTRAASAAAAAAAWTWICEGEAGKWTKSLMRRRVIEQAQGDQVRNQGTRVIAVRPLPVINGAPCALQVCVPPRAALAGGVVPYIAARIPSKHLEAIKPCAAHEEGGG
ncbi:hypothetical protein S40285_09840 [Stachybotrys chlorohalonatus IBT 40285]|uniref:Uncharacterized protein n=1 Tax=Stachybotrys chlorohalonatus (strain IBT 40285) TaxID=1283841 RepID=A0A084QHY5_STAC4|nr:hypothetical protein S40285_09840 [Stachybotrys chlorohalonata IBT 40285]